MKQAEAAGGLTALPTQEAPLREQGTILGTFQYMAPEQATLTVAWGPVALIDGVRQQARMTKSLRR